MLEKTPPSDLVTMDLGLCPYQEAWTLQKELQRKLLDGTGHDTLIFCEHTPTITIGRSAKPDNVLLSKEELKKKGVELFEIERGGDVTYHGPGQLVAYPILDLKRKRRDVGWYLRTLELIIINTLKDLSVESFTICGLTGVWTNGVKNYNNVALTPDHQERAKIASIGVRISRWCTLHGLSLNIKDCSDGFGLINPCGFKDIQITSVEELGGKADISVARIRMEKWFRELLAYNDNGEINDEEGYSAKSCR